MVSCELELKTIKVVIARRKTTKREWVSNLHSSEPLCSRNDASRLQSFVIENDDSLPSLACHFWGSLLLGCRNVETEQLTIAGMSSAFRSELNA